MGWKDLFETKSAIRSLNRIADALETQNRILTKFVEKAYPEPPAASEKDLRPPGGRVYTQDLEQVRVLDFIDRTLREQGREPTEDEIVDFLDGRV